MLFMQLLGQVFSGSQEWTICWICSQASFTLPESLWDPLNVEVALIVTI
jgi:hypothetical protein